MWKDGKWQDFNFFASLCCWWNKSIFFSVRLCSEVSRCEIHHNIWKEKHPFKMTRRGKKWVSSLRFYLFSFQLYPSIILFRAKYHQAPGRGLSLSARAVVVHVAPYGVNTRTPWFPVQMTVQWWVVCESPSKLFSEPSVTVYSIFCRSSAPALFKGKLFFSS